jgi:hypothetical protein
MIAINDSSPHENEYLAAVAGLPEQTPSQCQEPAVGDFVSGMTAGKRWQGRVEWINDDGQMCINGSGWWAFVPVVDCRQVVPSKDITH